MKAIWKGQLYTMVDDYSDGVMLRDDEDGGVIRVPYSSDELIIDPTDSDLEEIGEL